MARRKMYDKEKPEVCSFTITPSQKTELYKMAAREDISGTQFIRRAINERLARIKKDKRDGR